MFLPVCQAAYSLYSSEKHSEEQHYNGQHWLAVSAGDGRLLGAGAQVKPGCSQGERWVDKRLRKLLQYGKSTEQKQREEQELG